MTATRVRAVARSDAATPAVDAVEHRNEVVVTGRLSAAATTKLLPSGDEIVTWRLVVDRPAGSRQRFDTIDCTAFKSRVRRQALGWEPGEVLEVVGALHRRFWRGLAGLQSKCEVEVETARRCSVPVKRRRKPG
jgi:single-strand DNA-binding protein